MCNARSFMQCKHGSYRSNLCFKQASRIWNFFPWRLMYTAFRWSSDISLVPLGISLALQGISFALLGILHTLLRTLSGTWHEPLGIAGSPQQQRHSPTANPPARQPSAKLQRITNSNTISILLPIKQSDQKEAWLMLDPNMNVAYILVAMSVAVPGSAELYIEIFPKELQMLQKDSRKWFSQNLLIFAADCLEIFSVGFWISPIAICFLKFSRKSFKCSKQLAANDC